MNLALTETILRWVLPLFSMFIFWMAWLVLRGQR